MLFWHNFFGSKTVDADFFFTNSMSGTFHLVDLYWRSRCTSPAPHASSSPCQAAAFYFLGELNLSAFQAAWIKRWTHSSWSLINLILENMDFVKSHVLSLKWQELRILTSATIWLSITFTNDVISISQFVKKTCFNLIFQLALFMLQPNKDFRTGCLKNSVLSGMISREI